MATIVDALLVTLGLDTKGFKKDTVEAKKAQESLDKTVEKGKKKREQTDKEQANAQKKRTNELKKYGKHTEETFRKIRNEALATLAVFTGGLGLVAFAKHAIVTSATMHEMSRSMDMSARSIAGWQGALEQVGGTAGEANATLNGVNKAIAEFQNTGNVPGIFHAYQRFQGRQSIWGFTNPEKYIMAASALIHRRMETVGKTAAAGLASQLGFSDNWFYLLSQGPAAVHRRVAQNEANSGVTGASARAMQRFRAQFVELGRQFERVGKEVLNALIPQFREFLHVLQRFARWLHGHQPDIDAFFKTVSAKIGAFIDYLLNHRADIQQSIHNIIKDLKTFVQNLAGIASTVNDIAHPINALEDPKKRAAALSWWQGLVPRNLTIGGIMSGPAVSNSNNRVSSSANIGHITIQTGPADAKTLADEIRSKWVHMLPQLNMGQQ